MGGNHLGMQVALFLLLAVGVALLATILVLMGIIVVGIVRALTGLIPRFTQRAKRLREGSHELGGLREERSSKA